MHMPSVRLFRKSANLIDAILHSIKLRVVGVHNDTYYTQEKQYTVYNLHM